MNKTFLNSFALKWIAIITMAIDHTGSILFPQLIWLRWIGRLSFPIFCFLIVQGYTHTHNLKKYILRLTIFAIITEPVYDKAFRDTYWFPGKQNVLFTFIIGLLMLYAFEKLKEPYNTFALIGFFIIAYFAKADYGIYGILLILFLYICMNNKNKMAGSIVLWNLLYIPSYQVIGGFSSIFVFFYNGKRGPGMKYFFYIFYPLHMLVIKLIKDYIL